MTRFPTTRWSLVQRATRESPTGSRAQLGQLLESYWLPMYAHVCVKGLGPEKAEDLIQDFMVELLDKRLLSIADPEKGKFRTLLLTALDRFMVTQYRREMAAKRSPGNLARLDAVPLEELSAGDASPAQAFDRAWCLDVLAQSLARMRRDCESSGQMVRWQVFEKRIVGPLLDDAPQPSYGDLAEQLGLPSEKAAMNHLVTAKRQFARQLRKSVREYVTRLRDLGADLPTAAASEPRQTAASARSDSQFAARLSEVAVQQDVEREIGELRLILARTRSATVLTREVPRETEQADPLKSDFWQRLTHQHDKGQSSLATMFDLGTDVCSDADWDRCFADILNTHLQEFPGLEYEGPGTLRELMQDDAPPIELLRRVKDWINICRLGNDALFPVPLANGIYFLVLAAARVRTGHKITGLRDRELQAGYQWLMQQSWFDDEFRPLVQRAADRIAE